MKIRVGFEMLYDFPQPTPMIMVLGTHFTRASDVIAPDFLTTTPAVEITPPRVAPVESCRYREVSWCGENEPSAFRLKTARKKSRRNCLTRVASR
jgi:hypothetical protein